MKVSSLKPLDIQHERTRNHRESPGYNIHTFLHFSVFLQVLGAQKVHYSKTECFTAL